MEDNEVIQRVKAGDTEAFSILVEKYHRRLLMFIFRLTGCEDSVEDIGQDVFLGVYKSLKNFDETCGTPFSAWLFISARNRCMGELRKMNRARRIGWGELSDIADKRASTEDVLLESEQRQALAYSLEQLPEPFKTTILCSLDGATLEDIALKDGVPVGTVKSRLFRARQRIKQLMKDYIGGVNDEGI
jgi:RNA polymerase sigma-70 factor, ECF subfamily